jgi:hypothetical protein
MTRLLSTVPIAAIASIGFPRREWHRTLDARYPVALHP